MISSYVRPELRSIFIDYQYDNSLTSNAPYRLVLRVPLSWFFSGNFEIKMKIKFSDGSSPVEVGLHPRYKDKNPVIEEGGSLVRFVFDCPSQIVKSAAHPETIEVLFAHKYYPVTVFFDATVLKNADAKGENNIRMYSKQAQYKKKFIKAR